MALPDGWHREYEGRHGAEYYYQPRNLTVSVLPRYESALGRASEKVPERYVVRIHRLFGPETAFPVTLGEREAFEDAIDLAMAYMERVDAVALRSVNGDLLEAFTDVATYDDDVLAALCRSATGSRVDAILHVDADDHSVAYTRTSEPATVLSRVEERIQGLVGATTPGDGVVYVSSRDRDVIWIPREDGTADGTLVELEADADGGPIRGVLDDIAAFVRRRDE